MPEAKKLVSLSGALFLLSWGAYCDQAVTAQEPSATTTTAQTVSAEKQQLLDQLWSAAQLELILKKKIADEVQKQHHLEAEEKEKQAEIKTKERNMDPEMKTMLTDLTKNLESITSQVQTGVIQYMQSPGYASQYKQKVLGVYDKHFNENELKDLVAFYKTPTGQTFASAQDDISQEMADVIDDLNSKKAEEILNRAEKNMEKSENGRRAKPGK